MYAHPSPQRIQSPATPRKATPRKAGARLGRLAGVLATVTCGLLAAAAIVPTAAFAMVIPQGGEGGTAGVTPLPATTVHVVTTGGGMAGWQITIIALGAALLAAAAAVVFDRARAARRAVAA
jgi:hypothetical protein